MLTVARFDVDESIPIPNVPRPKSASGLLPQGFRYLVDDETGDVVVPVLLHLHSKYNGPAAFRKGRWTKENATRDAAADLKAWWTYCEIKDRAWDEADDALLANYIIDLRSFTSADTEDFLSDSTIRRRLSSIAEFYRYAKVRWDLEVTPRLEAATILAKHRGSASSKATRNLDLDPHPFDDNHVPLLAEAMGPLPSERKAGSNLSCKERLAFELALMVGLRVDEIVSLNVADFDDLQESSGGIAGAVSLRIERTKGLRPRTIYIPNALLREIKVYLTGERAEAVMAARNRWLGDELPPVTLLVNSPAAGANAGKSLRSATIEEKFNGIQKALGLTRREVIRRDQPDQSVVEVPRYVFHDGRHTFALWSYQSQRELGLRGDPKAEDPISFVQRRLGHAHRSTTTDIYLNVFHDLATDGVHAHMAEMTRRRRARDEAWVQ